MEGSRKQAALGAPTAVELERIERLYELDLKRSDPHRESLSCLLRAGPRRAAGVAESGQKDLGRYSPS